MDYHSAIANHVITSDSNFGIYITDGTQMDDFGGDDFMNNDPPCGNGWPVNTDPLISPGYPNTAEDPITGLLDIYQWSPPSNWYSIYDENASSETDVMGYTYHAFDNEHVGDFEDVVDWPDDAVWPTSIVWRKLDPQIQLRGDDNTCTTQPEILFPSAKIALSLNKNSQVSNDIDIYPNPFSEEILISLLTDDVDLLLIQILDLNAKVLIEKDDIYLDKILRVKTSKLQSGLYMLRVISKTGEVSNIKLIKQ